jgi:hypothetical protein
MSLKRFTTPMVNTKAKAGDVEPGAEREGDMRPPDSRNVMLVALLPNMAGTTNG